VPAVATFAFELQFDEKTYVQTVVCVHVIRRMVAGAAVFFKSATPGWTWKPKTAASDSLYHARVSAGACEVLKPDLKGSKKWKQVSLGSFF
jgi:hypothetical protein